MRCICCDVRLSPKESCTKFKESGNYTEMCSSCLKTISEVSTVSPNRDFSKYEDDDIENDERDWWEDD